MVQFLFSNEGMCSTVLQAPRSAPTVHCLSRLVAKFSICPHNWQVSKLWVLYMISCLKYMYTLCMSYIYTHTDTHLSIYLHIYIYMVWKGILNMVEDRHCIFGEHPLLKPGRPQHAPSPWPCRCCSAAGRRSNRRLVEACCDPSHHGFQCYNDLDDLG